MLPIQQELVFWAVYHRYIIKITFFFKKNHRKTIWNVSLDSISAKKRRNTCVFLQNMSQNGSIPTTGIIVRSAVLKGSVLRNKNIKFFNNLQKLQSTQHVYNLCQIGSNHESQCIYMTLTNCRVLTTCDFETNIYFRVFGPVCHR